MRPAAGGRSRAPGIGLTFAIAVAAVQLASLPIPPFSIGTPTRHPIEPMLLAIVLGVIVRSAFGLPAAFAPGVRYSVQTLLSVAIVLLGARLDFYQVVRTSGHGLVVSVVCVAVAFALTVWLCKRTGIDRKLGILIGVGTAICGGTAIAVTAPVIEADDNETAFAITTITLLGLVSVFLFPLMGTALGMRQDDFGVWAGTAIHATPQVMAAGFAYGPEAGETATIVKLVRVLLLAPMVVGIGAWYAREKRRRQQAHVTKMAGFTTLFPPFVFGFVLVAIANTAGLLPDFTLHLKDNVLGPARDVPVSLSQLVTWLSAFVTTMAMAGVGLGVNLRGFATVGPRALYVGVFSTVVLTGFSYALVALTL